MDIAWIGLLIVWATVEFVQFIRKRPFPQRMATGAVWGVIFAALAALGGASKEVNTWGFLGIALATFAVGAAVIFGLRLLIAKGWAHFMQK